MTDTTHLDALHTRLSHERSYLADAKTSGERNLRTVWISQIEKEIAAEYEFLGLDPVPASIGQMDDDDLLAELMA